MKRRLVGLGILFIGLVLLLVVGISFYAGTILKKGVETAGPQITKTPVKLDGANLAVVSGAGELKGLVVGNPEGYKTPSAISIGSVKVTVVPTSLFSDKVVVRSVKVVAPEVTFEGGLQGNNLSKLLDNIRGTNTSSTPSPPSSSGSNRRLEVDDILVTGGKVHLALNVLGGKAGTLPLPEIHLTGLGQGPEGITTAELSEKLIHAILESSTKAVTGDLTSLTKGLGDAAQVVGTGTVEKVTKSLGNLFKK